MAMTKARDIINKSLLFIVLALLAIMVLYPLGFLLLTSIKSNNDVIMNPFGINSVHFENYANAWVKGRVPQYFLDSVIVTLITMAMQIVIISLASYSFGKLKPWGHAVMLSAVLMMMFITSEMTTVPVYVLLHNMGLLSTRLALILPYTSGGLVMGTYILTNFIRALPVELDEAALIDGAGVFQIMLRVDLPLVLPALATLVIFNFNGVWSEFYWALITIKDDVLKTLPLGLINFQSQFSSNYGVLSAGLTILTVPVIIIYLIFSKYFIANISAGAVKG
jgi:raffinose/stachyose/melibiose transport system permease protein